MQPDHARLAHRLYLLRRDAPRTGPCSRAGLFEIRGRGAVRRAAGQIVDFDVSRGRIAFVRAQPRNSLIAQIFASDGSRTRLLREDSSAAAGGGGPILPRWDGDRLWVGQFDHSLGGFRATAYRYARPARPGACRVADPQIDPATAGFNLIDVTGWAFVDDSIYAAVTGIVSPAPELTEPRPLLGLTVAWQPCPAAV